MGRWIKPQMSVLSMAMRENIAASSGRQIGTFWYTGQGNGNRIYGDFYYIWDGNHKMVQDTYKAGGDDNIVKHDVDGAIAYCKA